MRHLDEGGRHRDLALRPGPSAELPRPTERDPAGSAARHGNPEASQMLEAAELEAIGITTEPHAHLSGTCQPRSFFEADRLFDEVRFHIVAVGLQPGGLRR